MGLIAKSRIHGSAEFFRIRHAKIDHCGLKVLVPEPNLNRPNRDPMFLPARRTGFSKAVQVDMLAHGVRLTGYLDFTLAVIFALGNGRPALATIETCAEGNPLQLAQKMVVRSTLFVHKNPTLMGWVLPTLLE